MNEHENVEEKNKKPARRTYGKIAMGAGVVVLIAAVAIAIYTASQPNIPITGGNPSDVYQENSELLLVKIWPDMQPDNVVKYGNAMEMLYAQPWLDKMNKVNIPVTGAPVWGNALELQYAQPWLDKMNVIPVTGGATWGNALEMQYAQPWLDKMNVIPVTGISHVITRVFATDQIPLNCNANLEMLYACKYGFGLP